MSVVDSLTRLEKALGLEPTEVPENILDVIELRDFTGTTFLEFLKAEWGKNVALPEDQRALHKEYVGELVAIAKMTFVSTGSSGNQIKLGTIKDFSPMAMRAFRAFQTDMKSVQMGGVSGPKTYKKGETPGETESVEKGEVLSRLSLGDLAKALHELLTPTVLDVANVVDVGKATPAPETGPITTPELAAVAVPEVETTKSTYEQDAVDLVLEDEVPPAVDKTDVWAGI